MIRPVGIQYTDFRHGGLTAFFRLIIILNMEEVPEGHCQSKAFIQFMNLLLFHLAKAVKNRHVRRFFIVCDKGVRLIHTGFS